LPPNLPYLPAASGRSHVCLEGASGAAVACTRAALNRLLAVVTRAAERCEAHCLPATVRCCCKLPRAIMLAQAQAVHCCNGLWMYAALAAVNKGRFLSVAGVQKQAIGVQRCVFSE
jgi:hypothetical protein